MNHTPIPPAELDVFKHLHRIRTVIDVGARADTAYFDIKPDATYHLFEPNEEFFLQLVDAVGDRKRVFLNNYGLADFEGERGYNTGIQAFLGGETQEVAADRIFSLKTLDWYVKSNKIKRIDFLKVDAEGYDYKVFLGAKESLKITRFLQYEYWNDPKEFEVLLGNDFTLVPCGYRNVLGIHKSVRGSKKLMDYIESMGYKDLA